MQGTGKSEGDLVDAVRSFGGVEEILLGLMRSLRSSWNRATRTAVILAGFFRSFSGDSHTILTSGGDEVVVRCCSPGVAGCDARLPVAQTRFACAASELSVVATSFRGVKTDFWAMDTSFRLEETCFRAVKTSFRGAIRPSVVWKLASDRGKRPSDLKKRPSAREKRPSERWIRASEGCVREFCKWRRS